MNWRNYQLENVVSKTTRNIFLWTAGKGQMEISESSLAIAIKLGTEKKGYFFHGKGTLLLDTIIETREGAVGRAAEKEITTPFIMLGLIEESLSATDQEDLKRMGYADQQEALNKATELLDRFSEGGRFHEHHCFDVNHGRIFAFPNENGKFDLLVTNDSSIVYKTKEMVFVTNRDKTVLKSSKETVCVTNGKSVVISKNDDLFPSIYVKECR